MYSALTSLKQALRFGKIRITQISYSSDLQVTYCYNNLGQVEKIGTPTDADKYARYVYNQDGSIAVEYLNNSRIPTITDFTYNAQGRLENILGHWCRVKDFHYAYNLL